MKYYKYELDVVRVKGHGLEWAQRATRQDGMKRYRVYHYKKEAVKGIAEWEQYLPDDFDREFWHNFDSPIVLGIQEAN